MIYGSNLTTEKGTLEFLNRNIELTRDERMEFDSWVRNRIWETCGKVV